MEDDITSDNFTDEQNDLFETYRLTRDQKRIFQSIKIGKNLFLSNLISDEEIIWNIGVMGVNNRHRGDYRYYRRSVVERLQKYDESEQRYQWHGGKWTKKAMRVLIEQWSIGQMVVVPNIETIDGSPMIFTKEWYEHWLPREEQPEGFFEYRATTVYPLMARSICLSYPKATMKGLVSLADMEDFSWEKYDMEQKMRHSDLQAVIPNKLRRMISVRPDEKMKKQMEDFAQVAKKYGFVMYDKFDDAMRNEAKIMPKEVPVFVGGTLEVDIRSCLRHLFRREPEALTMMEEVWKDMEDNGDMLHPEHMKKRV